MSQKNEGGGSRKGSVFGTLGSIKTRAEAALLSGSKGEQARAKRAEEEARNLADQAIEAERKALAASKRAQEAALAGAGKQQDAYKHKQMALWHDWNTRYKGAQAKTAAASSELRTNESQLIQLQAAVRSLEDQIVLDRGTLARREQEEESIRSAEPPKEPGMAASVTQQTTPKQKSPPPSPKQSREASREESFRAPPPPPPVQEVVRTRSLSVEKDVRQLGEYGSIFTKGGKRILRSLPGSDGNTFDYNVVAGSETDKQVVVDNGAGAFYTFNMVGNDWQLTDGDTRKAAAVRRPPPIPSSATKPVGAPTVPKRPDLKTSSATGGEAAAKPAIKFSPAQGVPNFAQQIADKKGNKGAAPPSSPKDEKRGGRSPSPSHGSSGEEDDIL